MFALCLLCCNPAHAEENPAIACNQQLVTEPRFAPITNKLPLGDMSDISFEKLAIKAIPTKKESKLIAEWVEAKNVCFNLGLEFAKTNYPPHLTALATEAKNRVTAVAASPYNGELSYGAANKQIQSISDDFRNKLTALVEQIKSEQLAQEQAKTVQVNQEAAQLESDRRYAAQQEDQRRAAVMQMYRPISIPQSTYNYQLPTNNQPIRQQTNCRWIGNVWNCQ